MPRKGKDKMKIPDSLKRYGLAKVFDYLDKDPMNNMAKVMELVNKFAGPETLATQRQAFDNVINDENSCWHQLIEKVWTQTDPNVLKTLFNNFFVNANLVGWPKQEENRKKYGCNIPWAILLDPTSACNLHCTGCWAAEYGNKLNLTFDEIDSIITQGKELGIYLYIYTGGEPLVRKKDLIALCEKHSDAAFLSFTNATLIDEEFCQDMLRVGNFVPAISLEGFEEANDSRRGQGVYKKVTDAMALLKSHHLPFGISACYTSVNYKDITSEEFYDKIIDLGAYFIWFFHYMPVGNDAAPELMPTPEQREEIYHRIRAWYREQRILERYKNEQRASRAIDPFAEAMLLTEAEDVMVAAIGARRYALLRAYRYDGVPVKELAERTGKSVHAMEVSLWRWQRTCRKVLKSHGKFVMFLLWVNVNFGFFLGV